MLLLHKSSAAIARGIAEGRTHAQVLPEPIDGSIVYQSVTLAPSGAIEFRTDPCEHDSALWQLLNLPEEMSIVQDSNIDTHRG